MGTEVEEKGGVPSIAIGKMLDSLPLGPFHVLHLARQVFAQAAFASCQVLTPYIFPGIASEYGVGDAELGVLGAAFQLGGILGTLAAAACIDGHGRRLPMATSSFLVAAAGVAMTWKLNFATVLVLRALQAAAGAVTVNGFNTWYAEFLPSRGRGPLVAAVCVGWPLGRGAVIAAAKMTGAAEWRTLLLFSSFLLSCLGVVALASEESPRHLYVSGHTSHAVAVVQSMYAFNGTPFDKKLCLEGARLADTCEVRPLVGGQVSAGKALARRLVVLSQHGKLLAYSCALFSMLAVAAPLLDTWGPRAFQHFLSSDTMPHELLFVFNLGDIAGIAISIFVVDRIGRRGTMYVGFFVQGMLWSLVPLGCYIDTAKSTQLLFLAGTLASGCRCFGFEAVNLWTLEVVPTEVRATALAVGLVFMHLIAVASLVLLGPAMSHLAPAAWLLLYSVLVTCGGVLAAFLPVETANSPMADKL